MSAIRRRAVGSPVYLLEAVVAPGERTRVTGPLWDGVLNATPDDDIDGPSPIEALMAALVGCVARNIRSVTDAAHVTFDRISMQVAADRSDDPPDVTAIRLDLSVDTDIPPERARHLIELALRDGTITRTLSRAIALEVRLVVNGEGVEVRRSWSSEDVEVRSPLPRCHDPRHFQGDARPARREARSAPRSAVRAGHVGVGTEPGDQDTASGHRKERE